MSKPISKQEINSFHQKILSWYKVHQRELPWRKTHDPYKILLSEVMSQQTQLSRVIPKYEEWIKELPTIQTLSKATNAEVLRLWSGLGYNRRAVYLKRVAEVIVQDYNGRFPQTLEELKTLPGIGEYTARAVLCFAFNQQLAVLDTNVRKVILTTFFKGKDQPPEKEIAKIVDQLLPQGKAYEWNQALMDYAAAVLKKEKIPIKKQTPFKTSKRFIRGQIIKLLIAHKSLKREKLESLVEKNEHNIEEVLSDLMKEGIIVEKYSRILLA